MSPRTNDSERVCLSQSRQTSISQELSHMAPGTIQDNDLSNQDNPSLCSNIHPAHGTSQDMKEWTLNNADTLDQTVSKSESPGVRMLTFSLSHTLMTPTVGPNEVMFPAVSDFTGTQDMNDHNDIAQDFKYSFVDFYGSDTALKTGTPDDAISIGHSSQTENGHLIAGPDPWNSMIADQYPVTTLDGLSSSMFQTLPVSPPMTEASNDVCVTSSCSHPGFPSFMAPDDTLLADFTSISTHGINPTDPLFPNTPLGERDPNKTIKPSKQSRRATFPATTSQSQGKADPEFFPSLAVGEPVQQKSKEGPESRNPREHLYYSMPTQSDGKYYCPYASGEKPCNHTPTTQKCAYHKYLDSHLKPYRCKVPTCMDAQLRFSSNACLFRHEREAHGLHGHGDNPHLCLWDGCERSVPGYGFPRRWNLYDHMRRVHDYATSERHSSPETAAAAAPASAQTQTRKKGPASSTPASTSARKRKVATSATPGQNMKRTRSVHSQSSVVGKTKTKTSKQSSSSSLVAHQGQRLQNAERNYYNCRSRLLEQLANITPQDTALHEKVNASLQELFTLGLNYRHIEASQSPVSSQMPNGMPSV